MSCANTVNSQAAGGVFVDASGAGISMMPTHQHELLIVGLGNPILGDDGIGWRVADAVGEQLPDVEIECLALGGLSLMERLVGYRQAIIIDAMQTRGGRPGDIYMLALEDLPDLSAGHTTAVHDTSLQTALDLGRRMGATLPETIRVVAIEAERVLDFSETLTPAVAAAIPRATAMVLDLVNQMRGGSP